MPVASAVSAVPAERAAPEADSSYPVPVCSTDLPEVCSYSGITTVIISLTSIAASCSVKKLRIVHHSFSSHTVILRSRLLQARRVRSYHAIDRIPPSQMNELQALSSADSIRSYCLNIIFREKKMLNRKAVFFRDANTADKCVTPFAEPPQDYRPLHSGRHCDIFHLLTAPHSP